MFEKYINPDLEDKLSCSRVFSEILERFKKRSPVAIGFVNPFSYGFVTKRPDLVGDIDYWFSDGSLLCRVSNWKRQQKIDRVSFDFSSIAGEVFTFASKNNLKVALIGGADNEISQAVSYIQGQFPELTISYSRNGFFDQPEAENIIEELAEKKPDIVVVGLGTPLQENFIVSLKNKFSHGSLLFTCGGFLSQTGQKGDYYYAIVKRLGLRWLQRAIMHSHVRRRLLNQYPVFLFCYIFNIKI